ncbi:MAG: IcmF-related protein [Rhodobacteraceae bacterium]|nr:IcmF-related protein [Paracoccaceae bacterium]
MAGAKGPDAPDALIARLAEPVLAYADRLPIVTGERQSDLLRHAATLLDRFATGLQRAGIPGAAVPPARAALALILDQKARDNPAINVAEWGVEARRMMFEGREVSPADLAEYQRRAAGQPDHAGTSAFVADCLLRLDNRRRAFDTSPATAGWTGILVVLGFGFVLAVVGWAALVEYRFHRDLGATFAARALSIGLDRDGPFPDLARRLDDLGAEARNTAIARAKAPVNLFAGLIGPDAQETAEATYQAALQRHLPPVLAAGIDRALATEGDPAAAYDTLRAWSVLASAGATDTPNVPPDWQPAWLAGWAGDRAGADPSLLGLSPHLLRLQPLDTPPPSPDTELLAQARDIAAEAAEPDRAYLELRRSAAVEALPGWDPVTAVPGLSVILNRKSGLAMDQPLPGLFTQTGWDYARDFGAGLAVQAARDQATRLFDTLPPPQNDTPDILMDRLQDQTLQHWSDYLADLRVRAFVSPEASVRISGEMARRASPLEGLLREVWVQAGGTDRRRTHPQQLQVAAVFGPMIQYVEAGRMQDIATLFAGLNVALAAQDRDGEKGQSRLMSVQDRAASVAALGVAPKVVVQLVEDTLAQTGAAHADLMSNDLTRVWQTEVLETCMAVTANRFPFAEGADAEPDKVALLLAPGGLVDRFVKGRAAQMLDMSETPWRWKPEALFEGLTQDSAVFLQRAVEIGAGLFPAGASGGQPGLELTLSALAERGRAFVSLGGAGGPVEATTDSLVLAWPGAQPDAGIEVTFNSGEGEARLTQPGYWGLLRLLAPLRLRDRDNGTRFLVDLRADQSRLFLEIVVDKPQNPLALRKLMQGFSCPAVL